METSSYSHGETSTTKMRQKKLLKKLTENEGNMHNIEYQHKKKNSSSVMNSKLKIDKSQTRSFCIENSKQEQAKKEFKNDSVSSKEESDDEELRKYVFEFKKKVEKKFNDSTTNKKYKFIYAKHEPDSESSIQSLQDTTQYDLADQNKNIAKDETEQLVDLLQEIGQLEKSTLKVHLKDTNSPIYQLLCQTLKNKIVSDHSQSVQIQKDHTIFATDSTMTNAAEGKKKHIKLNPSTHFTNTNPEHYQNQSSSIERPKRLSNKSSLNKQNILTNNTNNEVKSKRTSTLSNTPNPNQKIEQISITKKQPVRNRVPIQNIPFNYSKNITNTSQINEPNMPTHKKIGPSPKKNTGREAINSKIMTISSNNSNLTSFTNKTLNSALSPNCNISYSTLKSTNSNTKSIQNRNANKISSIKTSNSRNTQKSSIHKFQMNNNFLNLLKKKNLEQKKPEFATQNDIQKSSTIASSSMYNNNVDHPKSQIIKQPKNSVDGNMANANVSNFSYTNQNNKSNLFVTEKEHMNNSNFQNIKNFMNQNTHNKDRIMNVSVKNKSTRKSINNSATKNGTNFDDNVYVLPYKKNNLINSNMGTTHPGHSGTFNKSKMNSIDETTSHISKHKNRVPSSNNLLTNNVNNMISQKSTNTKNNSNKIGGQQGNSCDEKAERNNSSDNYSFNQNNLANSMLQSKKISKKKSKDDERKTIQPHIISKIQDHSQDIVNHISGTNQKLVHRQNINSKINFQKHTTAIAQAYMKNR